MLATSIGDSDWLTMSGKADGLMLEASAAWLLFTPFLVMIRPEVLLRTNSANEDPPVEFASTISCLNEEDLKCGLKAIGWTWQPACLQRFATQGAFVAVLAAMGLVQGAATGYLSSTLIPVANVYGFSHFSTNWILVINEITQGLLGLMLGYFCNKGFRPGWISLCTILHAVVCATLSFSHAPQVHRKFIANSTIGGVLYEEMDMCEVREGEMLTAGDSPCITTLVLLFLLQIGAGIGGIAFLCIGLAYIDDNVEDNAAPALIGETISMRHLGPHLGMLLAWRCLTIYSGSQIVNGWRIGWPVLSALLFLVALFIAMFPRQLPQQAVKRAAAFIVESVETSSRVGGTVSPVTSLYGSSQDVGFCSSLWRLLKNPLLMLNLLATLCLQAGMANFLALEDKYLESKFHSVRHPQSGFHDPWTSRSILTMLNPILTSLLIMVSGLIISRTRVSATKLAAWHTVLALLVAIGLLINAFTGCTSLRLVGEEKGRFQPLRTCNRNCNCRIGTAFSPVCSEQGGYMFYSPCHAGCQQVQQLDDFKLLSECSCVKDVLHDPEKHRAKSGSCSNPKCSSYWVLTQSFTVLTAALLGTRLVGNCIINFRTVYSQDKALAAGLELTLVGIIAHIPVKFLYNVLADSTCLYRSSSGACMLHDGTKFGLYLHVTTGCWMFACAALSAAVWYLARNLQLFSESDDKVRELPSRKIESTFSLTPGSSHSRAKDLDRVGSNKSGTSTPGGRRNKNLGSADPLTFLGVIFPPEDDDDLCFDLQHLSDNLNDSMEEQPGKSNNQLTVF